MSGVYESPRARCDVLVSYFRGDDVVRPGSHERPVSRLASTLEALLRRKLGDPECTVSTEHPLISEQSTGSGLVAQLDECRTLVLAVTPAYLRTHWMREGLRRLLGASKGEASQIQVVIAELAPTDRGSWPAVAAAIPAVRLHALAQPGADAVELSAQHAVTPADEAAFFGGVTELSHLIVEQLRSDRGRAQGRPTVIVAEPTDDVRELHDRVVASLRQRSDLAVISTRRSTGGSAEVEPAMRAAWQNAVAFVQLIGAGPGPGQRALSDASVAISMYAEQGLPIVQWRPDTVDAAAIPEGEWRAIATDARVRTGSLVEFQRELTRLIDRIPRRSTRGKRASMIEKFASVATPAVPGNGDAAARRALAGVFGGKRPAADDANGSRVLQVFVQAAGPDREAAREVGRQLRYLGVAPVVAPEPNTEATFLRNLEAHDAALRPCQGFIMVAGHGSAAAVKSNLQYLLRTRGSSAEEMRGAILDIEPDRERAFEDLPPGVLLIDCPGELHSDVLKPFVEDLKAMVPGESHA